MVDIHFIFYVTVIFYLDGSIQAGSTGTSINSQHDRNQTIIPWLLFSHLFVFVPQWLPLWVPWMCWPHRPLPVLRHPWCCLSILWPPLSIQHYRQNLRRGMIKFLAVIPAWPGEWRYRTSKALHCLLGDSQRSGGLCGFEFNLWL